MPLHGIDGEVGWRVPLERWGLERTGVKQVLQANHEWRVYAGGFHFDGSDALESVSGPRLRSEWRLLDLLPSLPGSRLTVAFEFQWDQARDDQWKGGLQLRIPFGGGNGKSVIPTGDHQRRVRRMTERIVRDADIVVGQSKPESALDPRTRMPLRLTAIDGNTANPEAVIEGAGANSLLIATGDAGPITPAGTIDMSNGQIVLGGGSSLAVIGSRSRAVAMFHAAGSRPTFNGQFVMAPENTLSGLNINGQGATSAIQIAGNGNFQILNNAITNVDNGNTNNVLLPDGVTNVDITEMGIFGSGFSGNLNIAGTSVTTPGTALFLSPSGTAEVGVSGSSFMASAGSGLDLPTFGTAQVTANFTNASFTGEGGTRSNQPNQFLQ